MGCNSSTAASVAAAGDPGDGAPADQPGAAGSSAASAASARATCDKCQARSATASASAAGVDENGRDLPAVRRPREVREVPDGEDDEDIGIDLEDPEVEQAATKIQAAFRGHRARKQPAEDKSPGDQDQEAVEDKPSASAMSAGDEEPTKEQLMAEFDPNDKELCNAATKIQASFRGHVARKTGGKAEEEAAKDDAAKDKDAADAAAKELADELADIDLTDPELHKAATKIQSTFRGHKVRKEGGDE